MTTIYQEITDSIIQELEKGATPWVKPWNAPMSADKNIVSGKAYRGINRLLLAMISGIKGYSNPAWATYDQWANLGGNVRKGEKAAKIIFFSTAKDKKAEKAGEDKTSNLHVRIVYSTSNKSKVLTLSQVKILRYLTIKRLKLARIVSLQHKQSIL